MMRTRSLATVLAAAVLLAPLSFSFAEEKREQPKAKPDVRGMMTGSAASSGQKKAVHYKDCAEVRKAGKAPLRRGQPGYGAHLDPDGDGIACK